MKYISMGFMSKKNTLIKSSEIWNIQYFYILLSLKYRCVECDKKLKPSPYGVLTIGGCEPRLCDYTGLSFCGACHWSATSIIPARYAFIKLLSGVV